MCRGDPDRQPKNLGRRVNEAFSCVAEAVRKRADPPEADKARTEADDRILISEVESPHFLSHNEQHAKPHQPEQQPPITQSHQHVSSIGPCALWISHCTWDVETCTNGNL